MGFLHRALLAITRKRGRTIVLLVIMLVVSDLVLAGFAIRRATQQAGVTARRQLGTTLSLSFNMQGAFQQARTANRATRILRSVSIPEEMAETIASHEHVADVNYLVNGMAVADGFVPVVTDQSGEDTSNQRLAPLRGGAGFVGGMGAVGGVAVMPDVSVSGVSSSRLAGAFQNENAILIEGRHITADDIDSRVALIERNLAEENSLVVGSSIRLKPTTADATPIDFTVVGIYELQGEAASQGPAVRGMSFGQPYNQIYTDYRSALSLRALGADQTSGVDTVVFFLDDPVNLEEVREYATSLPYDWDTFALDANDRAYRMIMAPVNQVSAFATVMMWIVAVAGASILTLVLTLSVRERSYETGVLLSLGESKPRVVAQYVTEVLIVALIAFGLSLLVGEWSAQTIGNRLLDRQLTTQPAIGSIEGPTPGMDGRAGLGPAGGLLQGLFGSRIGPNDVTPIDELHVSVTATEARSLALTGLLIVIIATAIPATLVMRYSPKQILTRAI